MAIGLAEAGTSHFFATWGRTDLRKDVSEAKFDVEADFDVHLAAGRPKPHLVGEKRNFRSENFAGKILLASKNEMLGIV